MTAPVISDMILLLVFEKWQNRQVLLLQLKNWMTICKNTINMMNICFSEIM